MRIKCDYCGNYIEDTDKVCPHCGAPNDGMMRSADGVPKTIDELKKFCAARGLPLAKMRFFIGQDYPDARAFGIFQDEDGQFVVYKNKADGSRAIRYRGSDEAYAVNEIFQKLKSEISQQRQLNASRGASRRSSKKKSPKIPFIFILAIFLVAVNLIMGVYSRINGGNAHNGYYHYNNTYYYSQNDTWYEYDDTYDDWIPAIVDTELEDNQSDYFASSSYSEDYAPDDFSNSSYYVEPDYSTDWDDDSDWDWGGSDWDSGGTDWDSDW